MLPLRLKGGWVDFKPSKISPSFSFYTPVEAHSKGFVDEKIHFRTMLDMSVLHMMFKMLDF